MKLTLHATPEEVMRAVEALQALGESRGIPPRTLFGLALSLEECASNIVNHALQRDPDQTFDVSFDLADREIVIELRDRGPRFDPTHAEDPKPAGTDDDDMPPGGWGIPLVRRHTDKMAYSRVAGENVLRLQMRLDKPAKPS